LLELSRQTVVNYFIACRRNYQAAILAHPIEFQAGGEYESDECLIADVGVGNNIRADIWVQSVAERATGRIYLSRVPDRSAASLIPTLTALVLKAASSSPTIGLLIMGCGAMATCIVLSITRKVNTNGKRGFLASVTPFTTTLVKES